MPDHCSAYGCSNRRSEESKGNGITFHRFPRNDAIRREWETAIGRKDFASSKTSVLCSKHFKEDSFDRTGQTVRLKEGVVPTVFSFSSQNTKLIYKTSSSVMPIPAASTEETRCKDFDTHQPNLPQPGQTENQFHERKTDVKTHSPIIQSITGNGTFTWPVIAQRISPEYPTDEIPTFEAIQIVEEEHNLEAHADVSHGDNVSIADQKMEIRNALHGNEKHAEYSLSDSNDDSRSPVEETNQNTGVFKIKGGRICVSLYGFGTSRLLFIRRKVKHIPCMQKETEESFIWQIVQNLLAGLAFLDRLKIVLLNLVGNVYIHQEKGVRCIKLKGFQNAKEENQPINFMGLPPEYVSPEVCQLILQGRPEKYLCRVEEGDIDGKAAVFALGRFAMNLYESSNGIVQKKFTDGKATYDGYTDQERKQLRFKSLETIAEEDFMKSLVPAECTPEMKKLLQKMFEFSPSKRISARNALRYMTETFEGDRPMQIVIPTHSDDRQAHRTKLKRKADINQKKMDEVPKCKKNREKRIRQDKPTINPSTT